MKPYSWNKAEGIEAAGMAEGKLVEVTIAGKRVGLLKRNGAVMAFSATCPHASAPLCEGWVDALGRIVCPLHKYRFDPQTGRNTTGEGYKLYTYAVQQVDDAIFVGFTLD